MIYDLKEWTAYWKKTNSVSLKLKIYKACRKCGIPPGISYSIVRRFSEPYKNTLQRFISKCAAQGWVRGGKI